MPSQIMHGRRKGELKNSTFNYTVPDVDLPKTDLKDVTILSKDDWERIQYQLHHTEIKQREADEMQAKKQSMIDKSRNLVQHWNNTIVGQRQMKLQARKLRELKDEEERKAMDIEEAKFQAEKRKTAIDKAKTQLYYQTDRVRGLHTALNLTEVLKERDGQLELKRLKAKASANHEKEWVERENEDYERYVAREQEKAAAIRKKNDINAAFINTQRAACVKQQEDEKLLDFREGQELKRLAAAYHEEKKKLEEIHKAEQLQLRDDNEKQIQDEIHLNKAKQQQQNEEDEECRIYAAAKRKMIRLRVEKEVEMQNEKLKRLDIISEKLAAQMKMKVDDEDDRIKKAIIEKEEAIRIESEAKVEKAKKGLEAIDAHRQKYLAEKEEERKAFIKEELAQRKLAKDNDELFKYNEEEKAKRIFENNKKVSQFRLDQHKARQDNLQHNRDMSLALDAKNYELYETEEKQFQEYASKVIEHCRKGGRNVVPLVKAAREGACGGHGPVFPGKGGIRPSYMVSDQTAVQLPSYQSSETEEVKKLVDGKASTKTKLGFVW